MQTPTPLAGQPAAAAQIKLQHLRLVLAICRTGRRCCAYTSNHPATGTDCRHLRWGAPRRAHGGVLVSPWYTGLIEKLAEQVHRERGRPEVLRTWGIGMRALIAEQRQ